jgi:hypothetical protein
VGDDVGAAGNQAGTDAVVRQGRELARNLWWGACWASAAVSGLALGVLVVEHQNGAELVPLLAELDRHRMVGI